MKLYSWLISGFISISCHLGLLIALNNYIPHKYNLKSLRHSRFGNKQVSYHLLKMPLKMKKREGGPKPKEEIVKIDINNEMEYKTVNPISHRADYDYEMDQSIKETDKLPDVDLTPIKISSIASSQKEHLEKIDLKISMETKEACKAQFIENSKEKMIDYIERDIYYPRAYNLEIDMGIKSFHNGFFTDTRIIKKNKDGCTFIITFIPNKDVQFDKLKNEVYFVIDRALSEERFKRSKYAIYRALDYLNKGDQFNIIAYYNEVLRCNPQNMRVTRKIN